MHAYRTHTCGQLRKSDVGQTVRLSGWCHRIRDHGLRFDESQTAFEARYRKLIAKE